MKAEHLIERIADGSRDAFEKLYNDYVKLVYATAFSVTRHSHDAEDVTAEVFVTVWNKASEFKGGSAKAWLCTISKNHALTYIKKKERERTVITEEFEYGAYRIEENSEKKSEIIDALEILSEQERETVLLFNSGLKHKEIAKMQGEPLGTITWRYNNALKKMRKFLQGERV